ncbi:hypothetical protein JOE59_002621 [Agromyces cerinus]|uniref:hypothetical protein n=1 Tax=Agromyces cerinus TaxID=33878 RepID=UPI00195958FC|nr:hypothetical protein [Agromyces cerinus]MBM7831916.1 hypothetical protein [Agromyces cerinus]
MRRTWTAWIGYVVAAWSAAYGALGVWWAFGGSGFPFGTGDPELMAEPSAAVKVSLLGQATPEVAGPVIAAIGLTGAVVAILMARGVAGRWARGLLPAYAWLLAILLTIGIQDYRTLIVVAYTPILAIGKLLGVWPDGSGWSDLYLGPRMNLLICLLAGIGWALTAVAYRRRVTDSCRICGRAGSEKRSFMDRWGRRATWIAIAAPLVYCATRWAWALGFSLGMDPDAYQEGKDEGLWVAGAALASFGIIGAVLTLGLIQRWGEVFPRWMIGLGGRRVPPMLAVVPAMLVSVLVTSASFMYLRIVLIDGITPETWAFNLPEVFFSVWGAALFVSALAYRRRRRGPCEACGLGVAEVPSDRHGGALDAGTAGGPAPRTGSHPSTIDA